MIALLRGSIVCRSNDVLILWPTTQSLSHIAYFNIEIDYAHMFVCHLSAHSYAWPDTAVFSGPQKASFPWSGLHLMQLFHGQIPRLTINQFNFCNMLGITNYPLVIPQDSHPRLMLMVKIVLRIDNSCEWGSFYDSCKYLFMRLNFWPEPTLHIKQQHQHQHQQLGDFSTTQGWVLGQLVACFMPFAGITWPSTRLELPFVMGGVRNCKCYGQILTVHWIKCK